MTDPANAPRDPLDPPLDPAAPLEDAPLEAGVEERVELAEERLRVDKRVVERVGARIRLRTEEEEVPYSETLRQETVSVERVASGAIVDEAPQTRTEGNTMIVPVVEEVLVKRYRIVEELRISSVAEDVEVSDTVTLRRQTATIDEGDPSEGA